MGYGHRRAFPYGHRSMKVSAHYGGLLLEMESHTSSYSITEGIASQELREWCEGYDIQQAFTSIAYPQGNGQAEVTNQKILKILRAWLNHMGGSWVNKLPSVLWALRTTSKEATRLIPFQLVYGSEAVVPMEVGVESDRVQLYDELNAERKLVELDLVDETCAKASIRLTAYRQRMKQNYNRRVIPRSF
ncbi:uncharacterized protein LOC122013522 [Zingiber officinale]|uniref:uncharacterized protein LOC122013522 n=1 Tax=Zingiber officinale TaxID=94328 RepID=UPI001C4A8582|nr:uncharacterized protein LOC122013522 [Zingiber officinale]